MIKSDFLIIGGSAAGTTAAEVIRSLKPDASITIITDEDHEEYSRVLIPHYIRGKVTREQVFLKKPEWYAEHKIELVKGVRVESLESESRRVRVSSGEEIEYGKLLISVGGEVIPFGASGADLGNIFYMRTIEDADRIIKGMERAKSAVVVGGGFIGLEFAHSFKVRGIENVTVLVMEPFLWKGKLDEDSAMVLTNTLEENGVKILTGEEVERFEPSSNVILGSPSTSLRVNSAKNLNTGAKEILHSVQDDKKRNQDDNKNVGRVVTKSGKVIEADIVGIGIGIRSNLGFLDGSGIGIGRGIVTNEYLETNLPDVYAAGDCAEFKDVIFGRQHILGNWANATSQGKVVGENMVRSHAHLRGEPGSVQAHLEGVSEKVPFETASSYSITFFNGSCSFIGVTDADYADEVIKRGSVADKKMTRIFVKTIDGVRRIVGATVINNPVEVAPLTRSIKEKINVSDFKDQLSSAGFDLKSIISG